MHLDEYCTLVSYPCGVPIPPNYPAMEEEAFRTATGTYAAAVIKALRNEDPALANTIF